jgi:hypothetical protein
MKKWKLLAVALATFFFTGTATAADIIVSAAASLTNAFADIGKDYEKANPGQKVNFNFGSSSALLQQISRGAPVDVFASADQETMDRANKQNLIVQTSRSDFVETLSSWSRQRARKSAPKSRRPEGYGITRRHQQPGKRASWAVLRHWKPPASGMR